MGTSIFFARIFSLYYLVVGVGLFFNRKAFKQIMDDFSKSAALVFFGGIFALLIGIMIILTHNIWLANWRLIITLIGWLAFIKGVWLVVFPKTVSKLMQSYHKNDALLGVHAIIAIILGLVLAFFGFFVA